MSVILVPRSIGPVAVDCVLFEGHRSDSNITENPIEDGSSVNDHAYIEPKKLTMEIANQKASDKYLELVELQDAREPFNVITGLAVYPNMLIQNIDAERDRKTSNILKATVYLREVVIVGGQAGGLAFNQFELPPTIGPSLDPVVFDRTQPVSARGDALTILIAAGTSAAVNIITGALG